MDHQADIELDLTGTPEGFANFIRLFVAIKNLSAKEVDTHHHRPAVYFRKIVTDGFFPIVDYIDHVIPVPGIYVQDPGRNAIMKSVGVALMRGKEPLDVVAVGYNRNTRSPFLLESRTPLFLDLAIAASASYQDYLDKPWVKGIVDRIHILTGRHIADVRTMLWGLDHLELRAAS